MDLDKDELEVTKEMYKEYKELEDLKRTAFKNYLIRRNKNASRRYNKPIQ